MTRATALLVLLLIGCAGTEPQTLESLRVDEPKTIESLDIPLPRPSSGKEAAYLGLEASADTFRMYQIKAQVLVIEVFDMYCRFCQGAAPKVNSLYELTLSSGLGDKVKMVGVGLMNSELEVSTFKEKYNVKFPLFADKDLSIARALKAEDEGTPHFIVVKMEPGDRVKVLHTRTGAFEDHQVFLDLILESAGMKRE